MADSVVGGKGYALLGEDVGQGRVELLLGELLEETKVNALQSRNNICQDDGGSPDYEAAPALASLGTSRRGWWSPSEHLFPLTEAPPVEI